MFKPLIPFAALLLTSCSLYKAYEPDAAVRDSVDNQLAIMNADYPADTISIGDISWRKVFSDPLLQQLVETAWQNNTDMRTVQLSIEQAQNEVTSAKWGYSPTLSFSPSVSASHNYQGGKYIQLPVKASWQLGIFGQTRSQIRSAKAQLAYDEDYRKAVQVDLAANVANLYYNLVMLDWELKIYQENEKLYEASYNTTAALFRAGVYKSPAVYEMEASLEDLRANMAQLRNSIVTTEASLCLLLAQPPHHIERCSYESLDAQFSSHNVENLHVGMPVRLLDARPDVRMAERNVEMAYYGVQQARQSFYPSISIDAMLGYYGTFTPVELFAQAIGSLSQPLFQGRSLRTQVRNAKADQEKARLDFAQTLLDAGGEVYKYSNTCKADQAKAIHIARRVNALQEAYTATIDLMNHGSTTYLEVLTAQESLLSAQLSQVENRCDLILDLINLYTALGGFGE